MITCSLLIPHHVSNNFRSTIRNAGGLRRYFHLLVVGLEPPPHGTFSKVTRDYQAANLGLKKINFRCLEEDWLRFGMMAQAKGVSMTLLFIMMLGKLKKAGVPAVKSIFKFIIKIDPTNLTIFFRGLYKNTC